MTEIQTANYSTDDNYGRNITQRVSGKRHRRTEGLTKCDLDYAFMATLQKVQVVILPAT